MRKEKEPGATMNKVPGYSREPGYKVKARNWLLGFLGKHAAWILG